MKEYALREQHKAATPQREAVNKHALQAAHGALAEQAIVTTQANLRQAKAAVIAAQERRQEPLPAILQHQHGQQEPGEHVPAVEPARQAQLKAAAAETEHKHVLPHALGDPAFAKADIHGMEQLVSGI